MNIEGRGDISKPTKRMDWEEYNQNHAETDSALLEMVKRKQAYVKKIDEKGKLKSITIYRNDGKILGFLDKEKLDEWIKNNLL